MSHVLATQSRIARAGRKMLVSAPVKVRSIHAVNLAIDPTLLFRIEQEMNTINRPDVRVVLGEGENKETLLIG